MYDAEPRWSGKFGQVNYNAALSDAEGYVPPILTKTAAGIQWTTEEYADDGGPTLRPNGTPYSNAPTPSLPFSLLPFPSS